HLAAERRSLAWRWGYQCPVSGGVPLFPDRLDGPMACPGLIYDARRPAGSGPTPLSGIQSEADLHCHLPIRDLVIFEVAAHLGDLKPLHISDRLASSR